MRRGPEDERAQAARGRLRASHADREQALEVLKAAFVQGRLTKDELDTRVGQAFASQTYAELAAVTGDIPCGLIPAQAAEPAMVPAPPPVVTDIKTAVRMIATATTIPAGLWACVLLTPNRDVDNGGLALLALSATFLWLIFLLLVGADMLTARREKRSGEQPPPPRRNQRAVSQGSRRSASIAPARQLPPRTGQRSGVEKRLGRTGDDFRSSPAVQASPAV